MLTQGQIDAFHRDGLLVVRQLVDYEYVGDLRRAVEATTALGLAHEGPDHRYRDVDGEARYYRTDGVWEYDRAFRVAAVHPAILSVVGQLLGRPFMPVNDAIVVKLPRSGVAIPWHQDPPYKGPGGRATTFEVPNFVVDIYLDHTTIDNGCVYAIAGHHLVGHVELERFTEDELFAHADAAPVEMSPGDVLVHCLTTPHGSAANASSDIRRIVYFHYMAREALEALHCDLAQTKHARSPLGLAPPDAFAAAGLRWAAARVAEAGSADAMRAHHVSLGDDGFEFAGAPSTPRNHWRGLIGKMSDEERRWQRSLGSGRPIVQAG